MKKPYTQLENDTLEALARAPLTARELRVVLAILRLTNGFHLTDNKVGTQYLSQLTCLPRQHVQQALRCLTRQQVVVRDGGHGGRGRKGIITLQGPALWQTGTPGGASKEKLAVHKVAPPSVHKVAPPSVHKVAPPQLEQLPPLTTPIKENIIKKTYKENIDGSEEKNEQNGAPKALGSDVEERGTPRRRSFRPHILSEAEKEAVMALNKDYPGDQKLLGILLEVPAHWGKTSEEVSEEYDRWQEQVAKLSGRVLEDECHKFRLYWKERGLTMGWLALRNWFDKRERMLATTI